MTGQPRKSGIMMKLLIFIPAVRRNPTGFSRRHRVTEANLNYMGSITIDEDLMDAANMIAGEKVYIADNNNGERFETYIIKGERGSGKICLNGAAARKVQPDDIVIIMSYALMDFEEAKSFKPTVIFPDPATNKVVK